MKKKKSTGIKNQNKKKTILNHKLCTTTLRINITITFSLNRCHKKQNIHLLSFIPTQKKTKDFTSLKDQMIHLQLIIF